MDDIVISDVKKELEALKGIGVKVPKKVFTYLENNRAGIVEYYDNGLSITEIADLIRDLA